MSAERILNLDGIPSASPRRDGHTYFTFDPQGSWRISKGSCLYDIEARCLSLHEAFKRAIMKGVNYSELIYWISGFAYEAGHSAEAKVSRQDFEQLLTLAKDTPELNRFSIRTTAGTLWRRSRSALRRSNRSSGSSI